MPTREAPHMRPTTGVPIVMRTVVYALLPGLAAYVWSFGPGILVNLLAALIGAAGAEAAMLKLRGREILPALADGSAAVTAALIAFSLPPLLPWWIPVTAAAVALVLGKHVYGGLGANPFNPAMVGYVVVLLSFPAEMVQWLAPRGAVADGQALSLAAHLSYALLGRLPGGTAVDAVTQATPLDIVRLGLANMQTVGELRAGPLLGMLGGTGWQLTAACVAIGGVFLLWRRVVRWQIPAAVLAGVALPSAALYLADTDRYPSPAFHLLNGATMLGAFFIATDPVTAPGTDRGRLCYGAGIGALTYAIRTWGGYPDGMAFAVLLMNATVPLIDHCTRPRIYGHDGA